MTEILISIRPKWVEKILNGEKAIEVRKSAPQPPFKAYIYCPKGEWLERTERGSYYLRQVICGGKRTTPVNPFNGKVVAEFLCDSAESFVVGSLRCDDIEKLACLSYEQIIAYFYKPEELNGNTVKTGYAWHISELKIYEEALELKAFSRLCKEYVPDYANDCDEYCGYFEHGQCKDGYKPIRRAPQSWQYARKL